MLKRLVTAFILILAAAQIASRAEFEKRVRYAVGSEPRDVLAVDLNHDRVPDLVTADYDDDRVTVLIGDGDGGFNHASSHATGDGPVSLVAADFDLDGNMDVATANEIDDSISILHGDGTGLLASPVAYAAGAAPRAIAAGLVNGDNRPDLVVVNSLDNTVALYVAATGDGFASPVIHDVGNAPVAVALADVDQNGTLDVTVANRGDGTVAVLMGNGHGVLDPATSYTAGRGTLALLASDVSGDGMADIIVANRDDDDVAVLVNVGAGLFGTPSSYPVGKSPLDLAMADFGGDCVMDLAVVSYPPGKVTILHGDGAGGFSAGTETFFVDTRSNALAVGDFNRDLRMDLTVARTKADDISLALTTQAGSVGGFEIRSGPNPATVRSSIAVSAFEAPFDDEQGTLSDGAGHYYVVDHEGGMALALSVHKNLAADAVRLGFNDGHFESAPVDELFSEVLVDLFEVPADGITPIAVTVVPRDSTGMELGTGLKLAVEGQGLLPAVLAGAIKDHGNGIYSLEVVSASPGTAVLRISVEGQALTTTPVLQFVNP